MKYSDSIQQYLPGLPYHGVKIIDLLHHTSGIRDFVGWTSNQIDTGEIHTTADITKLLPVNIPATNSVIQNAVLR
ncbi:hypothetical protein DBR11_23810 [Pedobacter sp. HMWF019]|uniref:hypothetical protein n=1 Tax=Pedobacter sp. HMWF019 TaxID=2056856 RepID=UPI000D3A029F|nr:hypothetical protein [Pedobacter sp. HMWF019]PTS94261.1 hypothetical protein DBR11_23810 [Pedobacter sp. HMWF019]